MQKPAETAALRGLVEAAWGNDNFEKIVPLFSAVSEIDPSDSRLTPAMVTTINVNSRGSAFNKNFTKNAITKNSNQTIIELGLQYPTVKNLCAVLENTARTEKQVHAIESLWRETPRNSIALALLKTSLMVETENEFGILDELDDETFLTLYRKLNHHTRNLVPYKTPQTSIRLGNLAILKLINPNPPIGAHHLQERVKYADAAHIAQLASHYIAQPQQYNSFTHDMLRLSGNLTFSQYVAIFIAVTGVNMRAYNMYIGDMTFNEIEFYDRTIDSKSISEELTKAMIENGSYTFEKIHTVECVGGSAKPNFEEVKKFSLYSRRRILESRQLTVTELRRCGYTEMEIQPYGKRTTGSAMVELQNTVSDLIQYGWKPGTTDQLATVEEGRNQGLLEAILLKLPLETALMKAADGSIFSNDIQAILQKELGDMPRIWETAAITLNVYNDVQLGEWLLFQKPDN